MIALQEYFRINKLTLNISKSKFMNILPRNKILPPHDELKYNGVPLDEVSEYKYLGINIDKHLTWDCQIRKVVSILSCRVGIIKKLSFFLPKNVLLLLYYSLIHCHLEYLCLIWGSAANRSIKPLQVLQNRCLKFIFRLTHQCPSVDLYALCNILPLKGIYCQQTCNFVKSVISENEYHTIVFDVANHGHDTRNSNNLYYSTARNNFGKFKISSRGPCLFNALPQEIKESPINRFHSTLKEWLLLPPQLSKLTKLHLFL